MSDGAKFSSLHIAANRGHADVVSCLIKAGADAGKANDYGVTPLFSAAAQGHVRCVAEMSPAAANPFTPNTDASLPLHGAAQVSCAHARLLTRPVACNCNSKPVDTLSSLSV
jgi:ankyrin repeat protein